MPSLQFRGLKDAAALHARWTWQHFSLSNRAHQVSEIRSRYFVAMMISKGCARGGKSVSTSFRHSDFVTVSIINESALDSFFTTGTCSKLRELYCFRFARVGCSNLPAGRGSCGYTPSFNESSKWQMCVEHPENSCVSEVHPPASWSVSQVYVCSRNLENRGRSLIRSKFTNWWLPLIRPLNAHK